MTSKELEDLVIYYVSKNISVKYSAVLKNSFNTFSDENFRLALFSLSVRFRYII